MHNYNILLKCILVGDSGIPSQIIGAGKSSIMLRFIDHKFIENYQPTLGVQFGTKNFMVGSFQVKAMIWDTAGQETFKSVIKSYYRWQKYCKKGSFVANNSAILAFMIFDLTNPESFKNIARWIDEVKQNGNQATRLVLVGNKIDQVKRCISREQAQEFANNNHIEHYYETSAKNGSNIEECFVEPCHQIIRDIEDKRLIVNSSNVNLGVKIVNPQLKPTKNSIQISIDSPSKQKCKC